MRGTRSLIVSFLALRRELSQKQLGARTGIDQKQVSAHLRAKDLEDSVYERFLAAVDHRKGQEEIVNACLEGLDAVEDERELTAAEQAEIERGSLECVRLFRRAVTEAVLASRNPPRIEGYPKPEEVEPARWLAKQQWERLAEIPAEHWPEVLRVAPELQHWALAERVCEESVAQASRNLERAAALAQFGLEIAKTVRGPEGWLRRVQGFCGAFGPNVVRVAGDLPASEAALLKARDLWLSGTDPNCVLDPGRLLDLEASLRLSQRCCEQALDRLGEALEVSRCRGRILIQKGFTLEVMGEHEQALETLRLAEPLVEHHGDSRLRYMLHKNLAVTFCQLGRFHEAAALVRQVQKLAAGDELEMIRVTWLKGCIAAGLERPAQAEGFLEQARHEFQQRAMIYDAALAGLELAVLLLEQGRASEVKRLTREIVETFKENGVNREALAALRLFHEAAERETATAELARRVLRFCFRSRYDQDLRFIPS